MKFKWSLQIVNLLALFGVVLSERRSFKDYHVYRLMPKTEAQLLALKSLEGLIKDITLVDNLHLGKIDLLVSRAYESKLLGLLEQQHIHHHLLDNNPEARLQLAIEPVADSNRCSDDYSWNEYHELNDTYLWLNRMASKYPETASIFVAGRSYEGRELLGLRISQNDGRSNKQAIFVEAGMHAREWISPATATYIANELMTSKEAAIKNLTNSYVWYILPHVNPDGYVYTHTDDRLWRNTRNPHGGGCYGTDPNRNWDFHWGEVYDDTDPCAESYVGPKAFSERETETLGQYLSSLKETIFMYISLHSYGQYLMYPFGYTSELPENHEQLEQICEASVAGMKRRYGTLYTCGNINKVMYPAAGTSMDWAHGVLGAKYCFTYELRPFKDDDWIQFILPASQIMPTGQETTDSLIEMVKTAAKF